MVIRCVAVVGKQNNPLYIHSTDDPHLQFHYLVHSSLDVIEEKIGKATTDARDPYLGLLYPTEDFHIYGYCTNTKTKLVIILDEPVQQPELKALFLRIHDAYTAVMCNAFYEPGTPITSKAFDKTIKSLATRR
eukprot:m.479907 g.479907  ORF g.479907 m.479907 type:complete len:133 (-) comp21629_c0_seq1:37-435(-)